MTSSVAPNAIELQSLPSLPSIEENISTNDYRYVPIDAENPLYTEELVPLQDYGIAGMSYYSISDGSNPPYNRKLNGSSPTVTARKSVAELLTRVNRRLEPNGLELYVWDAFRPVSTQLGIWRFFEGATKRAHPQLSPKEIYEEIIKYVSDPNDFHEDDPKTWPTHMTGASVDLTIRAIGAREPLDMGAHFDQLDKTAFSGHYEKLLKKNTIDKNDARLLNRRLLYFVMNEAGFTNYPLEFWHFDWKNQMHEFIKSTVSGRAIQPASYGIARNMNDPLARKSVNL